jgi:glycosyltransferase involved in cell wall biosynthesis
MLTVLLPAFNAAATIARSLQSLQAQTFEAFEVLILNDGSTDDTAEVVAQCCGTDKRFHLINFSDNRGLVSVLNAGLQIARSELVARLDSDDCAMPERFARQINVFDNPETVLSGTAVIQQTNDGMVLSEGHPPTTHGGLTAAFTVSNHLCHSSVMYRRRAVNELGGYRHDRYPAEDYDLWIRLISQGEYRGVEEILTVYTKNAQGISSILKSQQESIAETIRANFVKSLIGKSVNPLGRPRICSQLVARVNEELALRAISPEGTYHEFSKIAVGGPGSKLNRGIKGLVAPHLLLRHPRLFG